MFLIISVKVTAVQKYMNVTPTDNTNIRCFEEFNFFSPVNLNSLDYIGCVHCANIIMMC